MTRLPPTPRSAPAHFFFALLASLLVCANAWSAGLFERDVTFSEAEVQQALAKAEFKPQTYGGLFTVSLPTPPRITLGQSENRVGITAVLKLEFAGEKPILVDLIGSAGIRYDHNSKAFFLENPTADSIKSIALDPNSAPLVELAATQLMAAYFRSKPVYALRADASPQEATARWLLKSIRIEAGRVVATLSTL